MPTDEQLDQLIRDALKELIDYNEAHVCLERSPWLQRLLGY